MLLRRPLLISLMFVLLLASCGSSGSRPATIAQPLIRVIQAAPLFFGGGQTAPASLDVEVTNVSNTPLTVRRVRVESFGMNEYRLYPEERVFSEILGPGQTKTFQLVATAATRYSQLSPSEPLNVRAIVQFDAGPVSFREVSVQQAGM